MDDIEHLVRVTLTDRAAEVGAPADLVRRARGRARQGRRRTQAVGVAVAAAAVLLAVPMAARLWSPVETSTVDTAAAPAVEPPVPPFPFAPGFSPPGYGEPIAELSAGVPGLRYDGGPERWLTVAVFADRPAPPRWDAAPKSYGVTVRERKGALELGRTGSALTWQVADGRWLRVEADRGLTREALIGFAAGLTPGAVPVLWPFTFAAVPPGLVPDVVTRAAVAFRPAGAAPSHGFAGKLTVLLSETAEVSPSGRAVAVGARTGRLATSPRSSVLSVDLGDGRTLVVQSETGLGEAGLVAFAAGIDPTPDAVVGHG
ncbi:hypothetical protein RB614_08035 [Phytohabitans sp. ZYX-F-186]|uniref:MucB/RseB N-terminal domain-containing protein n=1 Tax=Phytohabitans maris TaxID=3071409 RepID=A0ABU0ZDN9_9ACTN|nr:hypothetical protein [Phytohabitans sp. ZYX-F-186]MDQ7904472.1 hypothetical protein [Phytohabitans sp. ZYX-F-186]